MKKNVFKVVLMILGIGILDYVIITEIDGIGRFAMILFGTLFSIIACLMSFNKKDKLQFSN